MLFKDMRTTHKILCSLFGMLLLATCADIQEVDLSDKTVALRAPLNALISDVQVHTFWWETLDDAAYYQIQIVSPSFDSIVQLVEEVTITDDNSYQTTLVNGTYQWTVIGYNSVSESKPLIYDLVIATDSSGDLSNQFVALAAPDNQAFLNTGEVDFLWQRLSDAETYRLQVASPDFSNSTFIILDVNTSEDFYAASLDEGTYRWRVRGENENSIGPYTSRDLTIDLTEPTAPDLISPSHGDTIIPPATLTWDVDVTSIMDTLYLYPDSLQSDPFFQISTTASSYFYDDVTPGIFFWRVRSIDAANNTSAFSETRKFVVE